jgi:hypothetical protein
MMTSPSPLDSGGIVATTSGFHWRSPAMFLMIAQGAMQLAFAAWWTLLNNFAVEVVHASGREIGIQQSLREVPGLLGFTVVFCLLIMREQTLALVSLALLGIGVAATGFFPTFIGFYLTTLVMSFGFHYYEAMNNSLALQWLDKRDAPVWFGRIVAAGAFAQLATYGVVFLGFRTLDLGYKVAFAVAGGLTLGVTLLLWLCYPRFKEAVPQRQQIVLRARYWLYYALTFMSGARRQIFTVFASFMMVQQFGFAVHEVALLFLVNCLINMLFAPKLGGMIARFGERWAITVDNLLLIGVFVGYAVVQNPWIAAVLYIVDGGLMTLEIAVRTYFQKIGDPADIAPTAGVAQSINHLAAVFIPVGLGLVWIGHPSWVFLIGAGFALTSFLLARLVPPQPMAGRETLLVRPAMKPAE